MNNPNSFVRWCGPHWGVAPDGTLPVNFYLSAFFEFVEDTFIESAVALQLIEKEWPSAYEKAFSAAIRAAEKKTPDPANFDVLRPADGWPLFMSQTNRKKERSKRGNIDATNAKKFLLLALEREYHTRELDRLKFWQKVADHGTTASEIQRQRDKFVEVFTDFLEENPGEQGYLIKSGLTIGDCFAGLLETPQDASLPVKDTWADSHIGPERRPHTDGSTCFHVDEMLGETKSTLIAMRSLSLRAKGESSLYCAALEGALDNLDYIAAQMPRTTVISKPDGTSLLLESEVFG